LFLTNETGTNNNGIGSTKHVNTIGNLKVSLNADPKCMIDNELKASIIAKHDEVNTSHSNTII
jgi:hypothetical protein